MPDVPVSPARTVVLRLVIAVVALAVAFDVLSLAAGAGMAWVGVLRLLFLAGVGVLVVRGRRWARILLAGITGLAALVAAVMAVGLEMTVGWRLVYLAYGVGTLSCLWRLFRPPAAGHFGVRAAVDSRV
jgi:hypothetical protein